MIFFEEWQAKYVEDMEFLRVRQAKIEEVQALEAEAAEAKSLTRRVLKAASFGYLGEEADHEQRERKLVELRDDLEQHWKGRKLRGVRGLGFAKRSAGKSAEEGVGSDNILIERFGEKVVQFKILFENPAFISLGSQTDLDQMVLKFDKNFTLNDIHGNSLVMDMGDATPEGLQVEVPIQP